MLWNNKFLILCQRAMCVCMCVWQDFNGPAVYSCDLAFTACFSEPPVHLDVKIRFFSGCAHSFSLKFGLLHHQKHVSMNISFSIFFLYFFFFGWPLVFPNSYCCQEAVILKKNCHWLFLTNTLVIELLSVIKVWARSDKDKPCEWDFPGSYQIVT